MNLCSRMRTSFDCVQHRTKAIAHGLYLFIFSGGYYTRPFALFKAPKTGVLQHEPSKARARFHLAHHSTDFRKVNFSPTIHGFLLHEDYWIAFDDMICGLADQLRASGNRHTLEVELRVRIEEFGGEG